MQTQTHAHISCQAASSSYMFLEREQIILIKQCQRKKKIHTDKPDKYLNASFLAVILSRAHVKASITQLWC